MATAPQNTLPAFGAALAAGATALESDLWLAADGRPLLSHGRPRGPVPALADLFAAHGTAYDLSLDVPDRRAAQAAVDVALAGGHDPRRLWLCGGHDRVGGWRDVHPDVRLVADARVLHTLPGRVVPLRRLAAAGVDALNLRRTRWSPGLVARTHAAGLLAFAWDVQTPARLRQVLAAGCDAVYSDHLPVLAAAAGWSPLLGAWP
jgi:glycerophosphoryl diester phosphodiesterase